MRQAWDLHTRGVLGLSSGISLGSFNLECPYTILAPTAVSQPSIWQCSLASPVEFVAFEPVECLLANLVFNLELNSLLQVTPVCAAASERNGVLTFLFNAGVATQGRLAHVEPSYPLSDATTISVRAVRLDNYALEHWPAPQFLKIDVEGGARAVLQGAEGLLTNRRPTVYIELHGPEEQEAVCDLLTSFRYKAQTLSGLEVKDPSDGWFSPLVCRPL